MSLRKLLDPIILLSVFLLFFVVFLSSYPVLYFYFKQYLHSEKHLASGSSIIYYIYIGADKRNFKRYVAQLNVTYLKESEYKLTLLVYEAERFSIFIRNVTLSGSVVLSDTKIVNYNDSPLLRALLIPVNIGGNSTEVIVNEFAKIIIDNEPALFSRDVHTIGFARIYKAKIFLNINNTYLPIYTFFSDKTLYCNYLKIEHYPSKYYILEYAEISFKQGNIPLREGLFLELLMYDFPKTKKLIKDILANNLSEREFIILSKLPCIPTDQAWLKAVLYQFDMLFPISYILVIIAILLPLIRLRRWA